MAEDFKPENRPAASGKSGEGLNPKEFKELVKLASHERKNLQLLVEYFEKKSGELDEKKRFFDRVSGQVPDALRKLDSMDVRFEEIKTFDVRIRDFQRISKEINSNYNTLKRELDGLHLLNEHIDSKTKSLDQQKLVVEKANEDAGRLNVLVWDMDSKIKKLREESKLLKSADRNIKRLEHMLDSVSGQVQDVVNMKELLRTAAVKVGVMKDTLGELDSRYDRIKQDRETIESHTRDTEELKRILAKVQGDYEKLLGQSHLIDETQETLHSLMQ
ncbi:MAG: hypothetical protein HON56_00950, partial [Nitrospina sp.]|nr:hypothetical protein [Nitrospina sp.]